MSIWATSRERRGQICKYLMLHGRDLMVRAAVAVFVEKSRVTHTFPS